MTGKYSETKLTPFTPETMPPREIIIEQVRIGAAIRVTATDTETGTEVVFQASASASPLEIKRLAGSKMGYVLRRGK